MASYRRQRGSGAVAENERGERVRTEIYHVYSVTTDEALDAIPGSSYGSTHPTDTDYKLSGKRSTPVDAGGDGGDIEHVVRVELEYTRQPTSTIGTGSSRYTGPVDVQRGSVSLSPTPATIRRLYYLADPTVYGTDARDYGRAIGVSIDPAEIQGIDVLVHAEQVTIRKYFSSDEFDLDARPTPDDLKPYYMHTNDTRFSPTPGITWDIGEALFTGIAFDKTFFSSDKLYVEYQYNFLIQPNTSESVVITKSDGTTETLTVAKTGWHAQWADAQGTVDTDAGSGSIKAGVTMRGVYTGQVYPTADFTNLKCGLSDPVIGEARFFEGFRL